MLVLLFGVGAVSFIFNSKYLLAALISLEYMVLLMFSILSIFYPVASLSLAFLTVSVCEGALGLSVLVVFTQSCGSDSLDNLIIGGW
uniref:NADH-ubiquinone oxidoreductase chain 4L n=1 Tax=Proasellus ortizi TaxID=1282012 RepID=A0A485M932_9CRUS|nr:NADH dehydrogenase subunit 4l [Proasellus ortizi]